MLSSESPSSSSLDEGSHMPLPGFEVLPRLTSSLMSLGLFCMSLAGMNSIPFCTQSSSKAKMRPTTGQWVAKVARMNCRRRKIHKRFDFLCEQLYYCSFNVSASTGRPYNIHWCQRLASNQQQDQDLVICRKRTLEALPEPYKMLQGWVMLRDFLT